MVRTPAGRLRHHAAEWIDGSGNSRVRGAQQPAVVLDGTHACDVQVLLGCPRVAKPAIIGDVDEYLSAMIGKLTHLARE